MQVAMWAILCLMLTLAGFVAHQKRLNSNIPLSQPIPVGDLMVRLPRGWQYTVFRSGDVLVVRGQEPNGISERAARVIQVTQQRLVDPAVNAADYLSNNLLDVELHPAPFRFAGLNSDGVSAEIQPQDQEDPSQPTTAPGLYAAVITPLPGGERLAVVVSATEPGPPAPSITTFFARLPRQSPWRAGRRRIASSA